MKQLVDRYYTAKMIAMANTIERDCGLTARTDFLDSAHRRQQQYAIALGESKANNNVLEWADGVLEGVKLARR